LCAAVDSTTSVIRHETDNHLEETAVNFVCHFFVMRSAMHRLAAILQRAGVIRQWISEWSAARVDERRDECCRYSSSSSSSGTVSLSRSGRGPGHGFFVSA
jgi:hypothetical protein